MMMPKPEEVKKMVMVLASRKSGKRCTLLDDAVQISQSANQPANKINCQRLLDKSQTVDDDD